MSSDPVLIAYGAKTGGGRKRPFYDRIGLAYPHDDGNGLTVVLDVMPLNGRIYLLEPDAHDDGRHLAKIGRMARSSKPKPRKPA